MTASADPTQAREGRVVGIGASAGGLESLEQLFSSLPVDTGLAFVVVQHLSPDFRSLMDELIARHSDMPVRIVTDGMAVEPNTIHLMPPRKEMIIRDRHLWLTDKEPHTFSLPIDAFFRSLAQDLGPLAVAVVLSGSGSDGSRGIVEVKRAGGVVMAESLLSAKFDGMPLSATTTGTVDHTATPRDIARILIGLAPIETSASEVALSDDPSMDSCLRLLRDTFGIDFSLYKMTTVGRRIQRRVDILRFASLADYIDALHDDTDELNRLYRDLLIGVTQFFRDPEAFAALAEDVIPRIMDSVKPEDELRVWTAGCATGEEAYSLAMLFHEAFTVRKRPMRLKLMATDAHQRSLDHASAGIYGDEQLAHVTPERLERFFTRRASGYQVSPELRAAIVFARHNVTKDAPFTKMHFISCRNMLIYFQPQAQRTVLSLFHFGLVPGGTLFLGASETPGALSDEFTVENDHWKVFRKRRDVHLLSQVRLPVMRGVSRVRNGVVGSAGIELPRPTSSDPLLLATYDQLLDKFMPPSLLVDEERVVIDTFAGAEKLLAVKARRPSQNVLELVREDLRPLVASAISRALKDGTRATFGNVVAEPLLHPRTRMRSVLVQFAAEAPAAVAQGTPAEPMAAVEPAQAIAAATSERMTTLETELSYTRETLQSTIEELETSNEEMQATNEELVASNEELQSTNEELHSVNEELFTVNAEHQHKITELKELNADISHLLEGTDVGTVFLDRDLRIRRFTSRIASVFRFQSHDLGRRILDFSHNIERPQLMEDLAQVVANGGAIEDEVRDRAGTPYFLRILPYRLALRQAANDGALGERPAPADAPIEGVVLTLTDMTSLDKARTRVTQLSALVEWANDALLGQTLDGTITSWNRGAEELFGYAADEALGKSATMLMKPGTEPELTKFLGEIAQGRKVEHVGSMCRRKDGTCVDVSVAISPIYNHERVVGAATSGRDITRMVAIQRDLEREQEKVTALLVQAEELAHRREQFLAMLSHELRNPLSAVINATTALRSGAVVPPDRLDQCSAVIERQAKHMKRLLDDLLDVSRITSDKFTIVAEPVDLRDSIDVAVESTAPLFVERDITLHRRRSEHALPLEGDARRLVQVVANLLANAATYSPAGSAVTLAIDVVIGRHDIVDIVQVRVTDEGEGIEPALQPKIFDLFVQAEQKLDRSRGGLGVGLSLVKTIVELHGGTIEVHSAGVGCGSEFVVRLPLARASGVREGRPAGGGADGGRGRRDGDARRIVLVDDQEDAREMLQMLLESRSHTVFSAGDGGAAVDLIALERPDVAFIDIGLPVMNGFEVAQAIRKQPELDGIRLVALSGYGNHADIEQAMAAGFDDHVTKPAELKRLEAIIAQGMRPR